MSQTENATTENKREFTPNINKVVVAFANTNGGVVYIGVADDGSAVGMADADGTMLKISN